MEEAREAGREFQESFHESSHEHLTPLDDWEWLLEEYPDLVFIPYLQ